jgi:hypothetical protein
VSHDDTATGTGDAGVTLPEDDAELLDVVRQVLDAADPMPSGLVDRVRFAIELDDIDVELSRLVEMPALAGARSEEYARLVTFQSDSLTIMVTLEEGTDGTTRIDGWLTPAAARPIEVRCTSGPLSTESDDTGRFSLAAVPAGQVRLVVHEPDSTRRVITPTIEV